MRPFVLLVDASLTHPVLLFFVEKVDELWRSQDCVGHLQGLDQLLFFFLELIDLCLHHAHLFDQRSHDFFLLLFERILGLLQLSLQFANLLLQLRHLNRVQLLEMFVLLLQLRVILCDGLHIEAHLHYFMVPVEALVLVLVLLKLKF